ncbi:MAG TPA: 30S ribosomal protein S17 [Chloroflexota bacterium]|nr:30S ribosomal protein S17 [Chloroflexota bacterium]
MAEKNRKTRVGRVVSDKMQQTVVVSVRTTKIHPLYKKMIRRSTKFMAHDAKSEARMGDLVRIVESRPISKMKHWRVVEVLERKIQAAPVSEVAEAGVDVLERRPAPVVEAPAETAEPAQAQTAETEPAAETAEPAEAEAEAEEEEEGA